MALWPQRCETVLLQGRRCGHSGVKLCCCRDGAQLKAPGHKDKTLSSRFALLSHRPVTLRPWTGVDPGADPASLDQVWTQGQILRPWTGVDPGADPASLDQVWTQGQILRPWTGVDPGADPAHGTTPRSATRSRSRGRVPFAGPRRELAPVRGSSRDHEELLDLPARGQDQGESSTSVLAKNREGSYVPWTHL